jgi:hypothetical protein
MTQKSITEIRDELEAELEVAEIDFKTEVAINYAKGRISGFNLRDQLDETPLKVALEALEDYASQGGYYDRPDIAQEALVKIKAMQGEK